MSIMAPGNQGTQPALSTGSPGDGFNGLGMQPGAYAALAGTNTFTGLQNLHGNGQVIDGGGNLTDTASGATLYRITTGVGSGKWTGGTNGARGDSIISDTADSTGATFFNGFYCNVIPQPFDDKGVAQLYAFYGTIAPYSGGGSVYGEIGGVCGAITNNRTGARAEGFEATINSGTSGTPIEGRNVAYVAVMNEYAAIANYWRRGFWASSQGTNTSGEAFFADGTAGWTYLMRLRNTAGTDCFTIDGSGNVVMNGLASILNPFLAGTATAGGGQAVPATVAGYLQVTLGGTAHKIPYFNV